jgi:hypothetical protein
MRVASGIASVVAGALTVGSLAVSLARDTGDASLPVLASTCLVMLAAFLAAVKVALTALRRR